MDSVDALSIQLSESEHSHAHGVDRCGRDVTLPTVMNETISIISSMHESEDGAYSPSNTYMYRSGTTSSNRSEGSSDECSMEDSFGQSIVDERCRSKMLEWCFKVRKYCTALPTARLWFVVLRVTLLSSQQMVDFFNIDRSIVPIATSYQDRFLVTPAGEAARSTRETFRIASVTSLYIAIKLYVPHKWNVTAHAFAQLCRGTISGDAIVDMEMKILFALSWNVNPPIPMAFVELFLEVIFGSIRQGSGDQRKHRCSTNIDDDDDSIVGDLIFPSLSDSDYSVDEECILASTKENVLDLVRYQLDVSILNVDCLETRSSLIAVAALLNAIEGVAGENMTSCPNQESNTTSRAQMRVVISFCHHAITVMSKICSLTKVASSRVELDQVRATLLCLAVSIPEEKSASGMHASSHDRHSIGQCNTSPYSVTASPTSSSWTSNGTTTDHYVSPKGVLSRVCAMHYHCQSR
jgi:hypothetical protein